MRRRSRRWQGTCGTARPPCALPSSARSSRALPPLHGPLKASYQRCSVPDRCGEHLSPPLSPRRVSKLSALHALNVYLAHSTTISSHAYASHAAPVSGEGGHRCSHSEEVANVSDLMMRESCVQTQKNSWDGMPTDNWRCSACVVLLGHMGQEAELPRGVVCHEHLRVPVWLASARLQ